jgi:EAL domain-containing protein (putative c-di-GMP-specific phosphodiesterase class I)
MTSKVLQEAGARLHQASDLAPPIAVLSGVGKTAAACAFVIDDEKGICNFIAMTLATLGVVAESYHTAGHAVSALERRSPDIIFLDVALAGSDAIDVIRSLGAQHYGGVVQLMSGSDAQLLEDIRRIGARHGLNMRTPLQKPFRADAVREAIGSLQLKGEPLRLVELDDALARGWLEMWYQPKIDLRTMMFVGAEALVRCNHPQYGVLKPESFLFGASDKALEVFTDFALITTLNDWDDVARAGFPMHTAVNVSIGTLTNINVPALIREHRPKNDKWPGLILEVTESDVVKDVALAHEVSTQLRIYGITFSIDDFGKGYSSFARLRELPFVELKLDYSFVKNCSSDTHNAGICRAIIELAHHFGALAVAEGLENAADLETIHGMDCDLGQGFFIAPPMPKTKLITLLRKRASLVPAPAPTAE